MGPEELRALEAKLTSNSVETKRLRPKMLALAAKWQAERRAGDALAEASQRFLEKEGDVTDECEEGEAALAAWKEAWGE